MSIPKGDEVQTQAQSAGGVPSAVPAPCPSGDVPREGSRDIQQKGKIISVPHDWCKSTDSPVPYKIWAWQSSSSNLANSVRQTDCRSHVLGSTVNQCFGDEPGTGGGVKSGTNLAECTPLSASPTVRAENRPMVRYLDKWWMNHKNTWGCLNNSEDMGKYDTPKLQKIDQKMQASAAGTQVAQAATGTMTDAPPIESRGATTAAPQASVPNIGPAAKVPITPSLPSASTPSAMDDAGAVALGGLRGGVTGAVSQLPGFVQHSNERLEQAISADQQRYLDQQAQKDGFKNWNDFLSQMKEAAKAETKTNTVRVTGTKKLKCYNMNNFLKNKPKDKQDYYIKEYCRQLRLQEEQLNNTSVDDFNKAQQDYDSNGRSNDQGSYKADLTPGYVKQLMSEGWSQEDAAEMAQNAAALHNPDQRWGNSVVNSLGDPNVNSSIGGGAPSRVSSFKNHLSDTKPDGNSKLNIKLCAEYNGKEIC